MIKQKFYELYEKYYHNGTPEQKAKFDVITAMGSAIIGSLIVITILNFGLWLELSICLICYGVFGMIRILYRSRVDHYKFQEKYRDK